MTTATPLRQQPRALLAPRGTRYDELDRAGHEAVALHRRRTQLDRQGLGRARPSGGAGLPDLYDLGMSNLGLMIPVRHPEPARGHPGRARIQSWTDLEALLREHGEPLRSLETRHALHEFDLLGITLQYEACYTNVLNMLDLGGIPVRTADRGDGDTVVIAGGSGALEPEPLAPFIDAFALGEGEQLIRDIADVVVAWKREGGSRRDLHLRLARVEGVYVPSLYDVAYREDGTIEAVTPGR